MDTDDDFGFEDQVEQEEREDRRSVAAMKEQALRHAAAFTDALGMIAESCTSKIISSPGKPLQNPSSASSSQSPSPASTPASTSSSSSCKRKAEHDSCAEDEPPCKRSTSLSPDRKRKAESDVCEVELPVRKRLRGKQHVQELPIQEGDIVENPPLEIDPFWKEFLDSGLEHMDPAARYNKCYYKLRSWLFANRFSFEKLAKRRALLGSTLLKATTGWRQLPKWSKRLVVGHFLEASKAPPEVRTAYLKTWPEADPDVMDAAETVVAKKAKSLLLTYIGTWGLLPAITIFANNDDKALRPWRELVKELRDTAALKQLWEEFASMCRKAASFLGDISWACCFEICMETYITERKLRVHGHFFLRRSTSRIDLRGMDALLEFQGLPPQVSEMLSKHTRSLAATWQGAFYCQCPKIGGLFSAGNVVPFIGYPVNGDWVFNLVQQQKIEYDDAKELIVKCGRGIGRRLQDLNAWRQARAEMEQMAYVKAAQSAHAAANREWREIPKILTWKKENTRPLMRRKKILVMVGRTGTGKTEYVKALFGPESVLELNAAGMLHPCLRGFDPEIHLCILWDEAEASLIAQNRKLFQCPACFVELGFSPTGAMTYSVMVNKAVMVVCSNRWDEQLQLLDKGDRDWILGNSVIVHINEPLFVTEPLAGQGDEPDPAPVALTPSSSRLSPAPDSAAGGISCRENEDLVFV